MIYSLTTKLSNLYLMKKQSILTLSLMCLLAFGLMNCKKKKDPAPDPYAFLKGTWRYANGAECMYDAATKTAKGTKVPTNNAQFKFVVGDIGEMCFRRVPIRGRTIRSFAFRMAKPSSIAKAP